MIYGDKRGAKSYLPVVIPIHNIPPIEGIFEVPVLDLREIYTEIQA